MRYGYARVSTTEQSTLLQLTALRRAGCKRIIQEKESAVKARPELEALLRRLQPGDEIVVYKLDRLARSLSHLLGILERLAQAGAGLRSVTEPIDTATPAGRMMIQILGVVAEFERTLIRERSIAGQVEAIRRGIVVGGRPKALNEEQISQTKTLRASGATWYEIGIRLGVSHTTARRAVVGDNRDRMKVLRAYL